MMGRRLLLLACLLAVGIFLVWMLGVKSGESMLGGRRVTALSKDESPAPDDRATDASDRTGQTGVREAEIPIREPLAGRPDVRVLKYVIHLGETVGGIAKQTEVKRVRVDVYNKKPEPDQKLEATITGDHGVLNFTRAPDANEAFRNAEIESMKLDQNVVVDYLDNEGKPATTLKSSNLDVSEQRFHVDGFFTIDQPGAHVEGQDLTYDKGTGVIQIERQVKTEGERFELPSATIGKEPERATKPKEAERAPAVASAPPVKTVITCDARFTFVPDKEAASAKSDHKEKAPKEKPPAGDDAAGQMFASLRGGLLTYRENVVAIKADTRIDCQQLDLTMTQTPDASAGAAKKKSKPGISHVLAQGGPGTPARASGPQGIFDGATIRMEKTPAGNIITLNGDTHVKDGRLSSDVDDPSRISAAAKTLMRFRPVAEAESTHATPLDPNAAPAASQHLVLDLQDEAWLSRESGDPAQDFRIDGDALELTFAMGPAKTGGSGSATLEKLVSTGTSKAKFAQSTVTGDNLVMTPSARAPSAADAPKTDDAPHFKLEVWPNPDASLSEVAADGTRRTNHIFAPVAGHLTLTPPAKEGDGMTIEFTGATTMEEHQGETLTKRLTASRSLEIEMAPERAATDGGGGGDAGGESGLKRLDADGDVVFKSVADGIEGSGDHLEFTPDAAGKGPFVLQGGPARATAKGSDGRDQKIDARRIEIDPDTRGVVADGKVEATFVGMGVAAAAPATDAAPPPDDPNSTGVLQCDHLVLAPSPDGNETIADATGRITYLDKGQGLLATGHTMHLEKSTGVVVLRGTDGDDASVERSDDLGAAEPAINSVKIMGPRIDLDQRTNGLVCRDGGHVVMVKPGQNGVTRSTVFARSNGPLRYENDTLRLFHGVTVSTEEDGVETNALTTDQADVFFTPKGSEVVEGPAPAKRGSDAFGFDRLEAHGRVHLEQRGAQPVVAEGQFLEWTFKNSDEVMHLVGVSPQSWITGISGKRDTRTYADSFIWDRGTNTLIADNLRTAEENPQPR